MTKLAFSLFLSNLLNQNLNRKDKAVFMHPKFKEWLIKDSDNWTPDQKQNFLRMAKFDPEKAVRVIASNLIKWQTVFCLEAGVTVVCYSVDDESRELFEVWKEHFAKELAAVD